MASLLQSVVLLQFERMVNALLGLDPVSRSRLERFDGKVLAVQTRSPSVKAWFVFSRDRLRLTGAFDGEADATVSGPAWSLLRQMQHATSSESLSNTGIEVTGDSDFVQDFYRLLGDLDPDWLEPVSSLFGDAVAGQVEQWVRRGSSLGDQASRRIRENLRDYLHEESGLLPVPGQVEDYRNRMDALRLHLDRLEARRSRLAERLSRLEEARNSPQ